MLQQFYVNVIIHARGWKIRAYQRYFLSVSRQGLISSLIDGGLHSGNPENVNRNGHKRLQIALHRRRCI